MLGGFALFAALEADVECLETFPHATGLVLGAAGLRKQSAGGLDERLAAVASRTGWPELPAAEALDGVGSGAGHDRLDAYLCAWVASLPADEREGLGGPAADTVWLPRPAGC